VDESNVISRAAQGDAAAWETLVLAHQQSVFRLAYLRLGDADDAEDVAQEAFIRAFRALHTFDRERPFRPWILSIAANLASNRRRSLGRYFAAARRVFQSAPAVAELPPDRPSAQWEAQTLWQAVRRLRSIDQEVIYLRFFLELSEAEIATSLSIAPGTVKSRLHRAMERLRAVVDGEFPALREEREA
jgi:RNA polymerase sigma-70 factor (ECF subfamily)